MDRKAERANPRLKGIDRLFLLAVNLCCYFRFPLLAFDFFRRNGRLPRIAFPRGYGDHMQWRKIFDHNPLFVVFSDKLATKAFLAKTVPDLALPKLLWVGDSPDEIPRDLLKGNVVVKANHGCRYNYFIKDGCYNAQELQRRARDWLTRRAYGRRHAEWAYAYVKPKLFVEEMLVPSTGILIDINIRAGRGRLAFGSLMLNAKTPQQCDIYINEERKVLGRIPGRGVDRAALERVEIPDVYDDAVKYARIMSREVDYARFDFLVCDGKLYGGEITVYPGNGYGPIREYVAGGITYEPGEQTHAIFAAWDMNSAWFMTAPLTGWKKYYRDVLRRYDFAAESISSAQQCEAVTSAAAL